jgi:hypothetical protein
MMGILINSSKTKISNNSHKISLIKLEKNIEETVKLFDVEKSKKISFINLGNILCDLKIFRSIFTLAPIDKKQEKKIVYNKVYNPNCKNIFKFSPRT